MKRWIFSIVGILLMTTLLGTAFFLGNSHEKTIKQSSLNTKKHGAVPTRDAGQKRAPKSEKKFLVMEEYPQEEEKVGFGLEDLIAKTKKHKTDTNENIPNAVAGKKPLLVLIIDDVSQAGQLKKIRSLPYHITPSIFPPSQMNAHSNRLAKGLKHYMIHLPMQSSIPKMNRMNKTMKISQSQEEIAARIREIRKLFPTGKYVNNHTGSVFTSNYPSMRKAYIELKRNGFIFIDSRTTGKSTVKRIANIYKDPYLSRDVFIDNVQSRAAILKQLKRAVQIAQKRGYAIAIGHPHSATFDALRHAGKILAPVQTVYIDEFYRKYYGRR